MNFKNMAINLFILSTYLLNCIKLALIEIFFMLKSATCHIQKYFHKKRSYTKKNNNFLYKWLEINKDYPYPDNNMKLIMVRRTGLKIEQVESWFKYNRRKLKIINKK